MKEPDSKTGVKTLNHLATYPGILRDWVDGNGRYFLQERILGHALEQAGPLL